MTSGWRSLQYEGKNGNHCRADKGCIENPSDTRDYANMAKCAPGMKWRYTGQTTNEQNYYECIWDPSDPAYKSPEERAEEKKKREEIEEGLANRDAYNEEHRYAPPALLDLLDAMRDDIKRKLQASNNYPSGEVAQKKAISDLMVAAASNAQILVDSAGLYNSDDSNNDGYSDDNTYGDGTTKVGTEYSFSNRVDVAPDIPPGAGSL